MEAAVWEALVNFLTDPDRLGTIVTAASSTEDGSEAEARLREARKRTTQLEQARRRIIVDYAKSGVDPELLHEALAVLDEECFAIRQEAKRLEAAAQQRQLGVIGPEQIRTYAGRIKAALMGMSEVASRRNVLAALDVKIDVADRRCFLVTGSLPLDSGEGVQPGTTWPGPGSRSPGGSGSGSRTTPWRPGPGPLPPGPRCRASRRA
jgi:hypothetical protein